MAYNEFAYFYDEFNGEADYDALYKHIQKELAAHGIADGIVADLGCGTGELTLMLTQAGYDMIGIDQSEEMLCVVRDKAEQLGLSGKLLLLQQDLLWRNHYDAENRRVEITVDIDYRETGEHFHEQFYEYTYDLETIRAALEQHGFVLESVCDGETFGPLTDESERYFFCAVKQYTQLEEQ